MKNKFGFIVSLVVVALIHALILQNTTLEPIKYEVKPQEEIIAIQLKTAEIKPDLPEEIMEPEVVEITPPEPEPIIEPEAVKITPPEPKPIIEPEPIVEPQIIINKPKPKKPKKKKPKKKKIKKKKIKKKKINKKKKKQTRRKKTKIGKKAVKAQAKRKASTGEKQTYLRKIRMIIKQEAQRKAGKRGRASVSFTISKSGRISNVSVKARDRRLRKKIKQIIRQIGKLPGIPNNFGVSSMPINVSIKIK